MLSYTEDQRKSLYLVLALLLHIVIIGILIHVHWDTLVKQTKVQHPRQVPVIIPLQNKVAALKPRASQFGATVTEQEDATFTPKQHSPDAPQTIPQETTEVAPDQENMQKEPPKESTEASVQEMPVPVERRSTLRAQTTIQKHPSTTKDQDKKILEIQKTAHQKPVQKRELEIATKDQPGKETEDAAPITKKLSFAQLAQGFLATLKNEGQDLFERKGDESIRPDLEEMKYLTYAQKVAWCIQNAIRLKHHLEPHHPEPILYCQTRIVIQQDGTLLALSLRESTDVPAFDTYYLDTLRSAAPFPPLPQHLKAPFAWNFTVQYHTKTYFEKLDKFAQLQKRRQEMHATGIGNRR